MNFAFQPPTERYSDYFSKNKRFPNELEEGNIEYKLKLDPTPSRFEHLVSQMKWRLCEYGICYYLVGISDDGEIKSGQRRIQYEMMQKKKTAKMQYTMNL